VFISQRGKFLKNKERKVKGRTIDLFCILYVFFFFGGFKFYLCIWFRLSLF